ncbi:hypothetical protein JVT61DRAFT_13317 [Boletus reticuloceps]|uniref:Uncharacterized protein n=1 Tax=Boletus reticuloceps TaxID=495285 RepID=A0A8I3A3Y7_9AGAM|nr:hypothetical protein JVT61DRAFT_13317 [Boletus reticuloceps]
MSSVMKLDTGTIIGKMEGYAIQGVKGKITGDPDAQMHWAHYFHNIVSIYTVDIKDWPASIPFANLSSACSGITQLETLHHKWDIGKTT